MRSFVRQNVGPADQSVRLAAGFVLLVLAGAGLAGTWGYLGIAAIVSAVLRYCPLYHLFGVDTGTGHAR